MNKLYYGDNLDVLRRYIKDESVDLIYLDPPFNSQATYNVLFKSPTGEHSKAQIEAFDDTWHWNDSANIAFDDVMTSGNTSASEMLRAIKSFLGPNDMMAYLAMMAVRLIELHRVLKDTGSLYLHCDATASHYLKIILDATFGVANFRNEITWKRRVGMSSAVHKSNKFGICTDKIFFYAKTEKALFYPQYNRTDSDYQSYIEERFTSVDENGRRFQPTSLVNPAHRPNLIYDYKGYKSPPNGWMITKDKMEQWDKEGKLYFPENKNSRIRRKSYADELLGMPVQNLWSDIPEINARAQERLGYPTQKPLALLERIVSASSKTGDTVLDPFCGCGTALDAAQKLDRQWIGIDVTHLAVGLIEQRLAHRYPAAKFQVIGTPGDLEAARDLFARSPHEFQLWACGRILAQPYKGGKKGADTGIDGIIYFKPDGKTTEKAIVSVKGGANVSVPMIRDLGHVVDREGARLGIFITLAEPTGPMKREAAGAGLYDVPGWRKVPKIQILTIADLFDRRQPDIPARDASEFKRAERADTSETKQAKLI